MFLGLVPHFCGGQFAELLIDQRQQFIGSLWIAYFNGSEYAGDLAHV